jgi:hypothetical protein
MRRMKWPITFALFSFITACDGCDDQGGPRAEIGGPVDVDGDGIVDSEDGDIDNDGIPNAVDLDIDGDRTGNEEDGDIDGDGIANADDDDPWGANPDGVDGPYADPDDDGVPNGLDNDDDGDGVPDGVDGANDCNGDGILEDENNDCDGFCLFPESGLVTCDDGSPPGTGSPDLDGDGTPDTIDPDDDGDNVPDLDDTQPGGSDPCVGIEIAPPASCFPPDPDPPGDTDPDQPVVPTPEDPPPDEPPPGPVCSTETFDPQQPIPPRILLVVDRSASMEETAPGFSGSKWEATREALVGPLFGADDGVVGQLETTVEMGLLTYPADSADDVCAEGQLVRAIDIENHGSIKTAMYFTEPTGATPTAASLLQAKGVLDFLSDDGGQRAIILATDGGPNCNRTLDGDTCRCVGTRTQCQNFSANCLDDVNAVGAASQLAGAGYPVYVLGINGSESFGDVLTAMASAGGTGDYTPVSSSASLATAIEGIATEVGTCLFDVAGFPDEGTLTVKVDGVAKPHDNTRSNGWDLVGLSTLELFGPACDAARTAQAITVERCE